VSGFVITKRLDNPPTSFQNQGRSIGLLGGSFNPAHAGHKHISLVALKRLGLDEVWWLVTPQNPLKETKGTPSLSERVTQASLIAAHPSIHVTDIERKLGTQYTFDTVRALTSRNPSTNFVWIMGADNFIQLPQWKDWSALMHLIPMVIIARPEHHLKAGLSKVALAFSRERLDPQISKTLPYCTAPAWTLIMDKLMPVSSTEIRANQDK
jgi:nicotinate-nucleotide adenylyltransferase